MLTKVIINIQPAGSKDISKALLDSFPRGAAECCLQPQRNLGVPPGPKAASTCGNPKQIGFKVNMNDGSPHFNGSCSVIPSTGEYKDKTVSVSALFGPEGPVPKKSQGSLCTQCKGGLNQILCVK